MSTFMTNHCRETYSGCNDGNAHFRVPCECPCSDCRQARTAKTPTTNSPVETSKASVLLDSTVYDTSTLIDFVERHYHAEKRRTKHLKRKPNPWPHVSDACKALSWSERRVQLACRAPLVLSTRTGARHTPSGAMRIEHTDFIEDPTIRRWLRTGKDETDEERLLRYAADFQRRRGSWPTARAAARSLRWTLERVEKACEASDVLGLSVVPLAQRRVEGFS